jgi:hypothetical protein
MRENLDKLQALAQQPAAVRWFKGLFNRVHVRMTDTGEQFTIVHHGDRVKVTEGFQGAGDFVVPLESQNVRNLSGFFDDEQVDAYEQYRIVKFMLRPCLEAALGLPILQNEAVRTVLRLDTCWQEAILDPDGNEDEQLTVSCEKNQWTVTPGYHGKPQRRLVMKPEQVLDYQRRVFEADEKKSLGAWLDLARWYVKWRDQVSVPV